LLVCWFTSRNESDEIERKKEGVLREMFPFAADATPIPSSTNESGAFGRGIFPKNL
jgi:hypothetical protein